MSVSSSAVSGSVSSSNSSAGVSLGVEEAFSIGPGSGGVDVASVSDGNSSGGEACALPLPKTFINCSSVTQIFPTQSSSNDPRFAVRFSATISFAKSFARPFCASPSHSEIFETIDRIKLLANAGGVEVAADVVASPRTIDDVDAVDVA